MDEETTRRLPSWMLPGGGGAAAATAAAAAATADPDKKKKKEEEEEEEDDPREGEEEEEISNSLRKSRFSVRRCQSKRSTSNKDKDTKVIRKRKHKVIAAVPAPVPEYSQEDSGLTVEDLVSIAQEYIHGNKLSEQKHLTINEHELAIDLPTTDTAVNPCEWSLVAHEKKDRSPSGEKQSFVSFNRSGDPAQDMLVLLLGPLLNKPAEEEKRPELVLEDSAFFQNLENQHQDDIREEMVPPVKKKASLKSKVSMLLD